MKNKEKDNIDNNIDNNNNKNKNKKKHNKDRAKEKETRTHLEGRVFVRWFATGACNYELLPILKKTQSWKCYQ